MPYGTDQGLINYLAQDGRALPVSSVASHARYAGSRYIDGTYEARFMGVAVSDAASFPRDRWVIVPERVEYASYEAAYIWASNAAALSVSGVSSIGVVKRERVEGAVEVEYATTASDKGAVADAVPLFTVIEGLLTPYINKVGGYHPTALVV